TMINRMKKTMQPILSYVEDKKIEIVVENHVGLAGLKAFILPLKQEINHPKFGLLLDFGNFNPKNDIYDMIPKLEDFIHLVHCKSYNFDEKGEETTLDYNRIMRELNEISYNGYYSIEYEGKGDNLKGTKKTLELMKKYLR
ncbi:MAG: TIM barrel protein, partial [Candidatus Lokiarchaeota archaeon]|nr:TIM barrel protein [Candidatus Lokiarchaeota archaeon]